MNLPNFLKEELSWKSCFLVQLCIQLQLQHLGQFKKMDQSMQLNQLIHSLWYCFQMQDEKDWIVFQIPSVMFILINSHEVGLYPSNIQAISFGISCLLPPFLGIFLSRLMLVCFLSYQWLMCWKDIVLHWFYHLCTLMASQQIFQFFNSNQRQQLHILMDLWLEWP